MKRAGQNTSKGGIKTEKTEYMGAQYIEHKMRDLVLTHHVPVPELQGEGMSKIMWFMCQILKFTSEKCLNDEFLNSEDCRQVLSCYFFPHVMEYWKLHPDKTECMTKEKYTLNQNVYNAFLLKLLDNLLIYASRFDIVEPIHTDAMINLAVSLTNLLVDFSDEECHRLFCRVRHICMAILFGKNKVELEEIIPTCQVELFLVEVENITSNLTCASQRSSVSTPSQTSKQMDSMKVLEVNGANRECNLLILCLNILAVQRIPLESEWPKTKIILQLIDTAKRPVLLHILRYLNAGRLSTTACVSTKYLNQIYEYVGRVFYMVHVKPKIQTDEASSYWSTEADQFELFLNNVIDFIKDNTDFIHLTLDFIKSSWPDFRKIFYATNESHNMFCREKLSGFLFSLEHILENFSEKLNFQRYKIGHMVMIIMTNGTSFTKFNNLCETLFDDLFARSINEDMFMQTFTEFWEILKAEIKCSPCKGSHIELYKLILATFSVKFLKHCSDRKPTESICLTFNNIFSSLFEHGKKVFVNWSYKVAHCYEPVLETLGQLNENIVGVDAINNQLGYPDDLSLSPAESALHSYTEITARVGKPADKYLDLDIQRLLFKQKKLVKGKPSRQGRAQVATMIEKMLSSDSHRSLAIQLIFPYLNIMSMRDTSIEIYPVTIDGEEKFIFGPGMISRVVSVFKNIISGEFAAIANVEKFNEEELEKIVDIIEKIVHLILKNPALAGLNSQFSTFLLIPLVHGYAYKTDAVFHVLALFVSKLAHFDYLTNNYNKADLVQLANLACVVHDKEYIFFKELVRFLFKRLSETNFAQQANIALSKINSKFPIFKFEYEDHIAICIHENLVLALDEKTLHRKRLKGSKYIGGVLQALDYSSISSIFVDCTDKVKLGRRLVALALESNNHSEIVKLYTELLDIDGGEILSTTMILSLFSLLMPTLEPCSLKEVEKRIDEELGTKMAKNENQCIHLLLGGDPCFIDEMAWPLYQYFRFDNKIDYQAKINEYCHKITKLLPFPKFAAIGAHEQYMFKALFETLYGKSGSSNTANRTHDPLSLIVNHTQYLKEPTELTKYLFTRSAVRYVLIFKLMDDRNKEQFYYQLTPILKILMTFSFLRCIGLELFGEIFNKSTSDSMKQEIQIELIIPVNALCIPLEENLPGEEDIRKRCSEILVDLMALRDETKQTIHQYNYVQQLLPSSYKNDITFTCRNLKTEDSKRFDLEYREDRTDLRKLLEVHTSVLPRGNKLETPIYVQIYSIQQIFLLFEKSSERIRIVNTFPDQVRELKHRLGFCDIKNDKVKKAISKLVPCLLVDGGWLEPSSRCSLPEEEISMYPFPEGSGLSAKTPMTGIKSKWFANKFLRMYCHIILDFDTNIPTREYHSLTSLWPQIYEDMNEFDGIELDPDVKLMIRNAKKVAKMISGNMTVIPTPDNDLLDIYELNREKRLTDPNSPTVWRPTFC